MNKNMNKTFIIMVIYDKANYYYSLSYRNGVEWVK